MMDYLKNNHEDGILGSENLSGVTPHEIKVSEKRLIRKADIRILPILGVLYTICLIDRSNISVARISGLDEDLRLTVGSRASIVLLVFFIGYALLEIPGNMAVKRLGPAIWFSAIAISWGAVTVGIGFVQDWKALAVCRALLGAFEAGLFPGCVYLIGSWYTRYEVQKRLAAFYVLATGISSFGNIFAYGLVQIPNAPFSATTLDSRWRWIYIIEGAVTCVVGMAAYFNIIDFPDSHRNKFLHQREIEILKARLMLDRGKENAEKVTWKHIWTTCKDWKTWAFAYMYMSAAVGSYAFLLSLPLILKDSLQFSTAMAFTLAAPPAIFSAIVAATFSWVADKTRMRGPYVVLQCLIGIVGLCITGFHSEPAPRYIGTFLGEAGVSGMVVTTLAWQNNSVLGDAKRSIASAIMISASAVGGTYSSLVFRQQDAPNYVLGITAVIAVLVGVLVVACSTMFMFRRANKLAARNLKVVEGSDSFMYTI
ncbi:major facilitator superfamily domain-containing protein [Tricladium varicosporioides]|nr:major facilitator superfamily domain-containing protein [Hymenoscyphus varicosporioides]